MISKTCCLVPIFNEGPRILTVLKKLTQCKLIDEIIVIDDGSTDNLFVQIQEIFPFIRVIRFDKNQGKTEAIRKVLVISKGNIIILLDGDFILESSGELDSAINFFINNSKIDALILRRMDDFFIYKIIRSDIVISGQRILRRKDLQNALSRSLSRFQLELAINDYLFQNKKIYGWLPLHGKDVYKSVKFGLLNGILKEVKMWLDLFRFKGVLYYFYSLLTFCPKQASSLSLS